MPILPPSINPKIPTGLAIFIIVFAVFGIVAGIAGANSQYPAVRIIGGVAMVVSFLLMFGVIGYAEVLFKGRGEMITHVTSGDFLRAPFWIKTLFLFGILLLSFGLLGTFHGTSLFTPRVALAASSIAMLFIAVSMKAFVLRLESNEDVAVPPSFLLWLKWIVLILAVPLFVVGPISIYYGLSRFWASVLLLGILGIIMAYAKLRRS